MPANSDSFGESAPESAWDAAEPWAVMRLDSQEPLPPNNEPMADCVSFDELASVEPMSLSLELMADGSVWLNGDVLMCPCPDCRAPMTIRLWLMLADCWSCGVTIELTEQQEREAKRLLEKAAAMAAPRPAAPATPASSRAPADPAPVSGAAAVEPAGAGVMATAPAASQAAAPPPPPAAQRPARRRRRRRVVAPVAGGTAWTRSLFRDTPAWLISLIFHLILLTLLGIWHLTQREDDRFITLTTALSRDVREGGDIFEMNPEDELVFDLPTPDIDSPRVREAMIRADQDAKELRIDPESKNSNLPELDIVRSQVSQAGDLRRALAARDPRIRVEMVKKEGGTTLTEAAVARGLRWLAAHQDPEGHWSLDRFGRKQGCNCSGNGVRCDSAGVSLALFPFLGAGQTHLVGRYKDTVARGLRWLVEHQKPDGDLRAGASGNTGMYAHGQATIVLCEAYLMTGDEQLRESAQKAVDFIVKAQHIGGGWRYHPQQAGDTSVLGWQLMALQSARAAGLDVPEETLGLASNFLDTVQRDGGARYSYQPRQGATAPMTAEALLCRMYLGWKRDDPGIRDGVDWLLDEHLPSRGNPNIYYWYYGTQTLHHHGGEEWEKWNVRMRDVLVQMQRKDGHAAGSWDPRGPHAGAGGRIYMTALAVCTLEVYYRHLPIFRQIDLD